MKNKIATFNDALAARSTVIFSSMYAFYVFLMFGLLPLLFPKAQDKLLYWSNVLQLVALPLLAVGQKVLNDKHDSLHDKVDTMMVSNADKEVADGSDPV